MSGRLDGVGIVITRPRPAAEALAAALVREGARPFIFPALAIEDLPHSDALESALAILPRAALAIFVSAHAVQKGIAAAARHGSWPAGPRVAAIGEATAEALRAAGFRSVVSPHERHDSEALLALPELEQVAGRDVVIFRGEGGREHLREVLESRGARVSYAQCYRRVRPAADAAPLLQGWSRGEVDAVSALSAETLENFVAMIGEEGARRLGSTTLVVPHEAIAGHALARRFARVAVAGPGAEGIAVALSPSRAHP
ncbi:MAG TPA: uroporphyrinogen-III synthase [Usitatibacter sp.]|nr:uroporphyrinogen-III synthase [Usitatibacter sp.]